MFAKYNMTLEAGEWTSPFKSDVLMVEKKVRVRVHRTCHRCQSQYGVDRVCQNCSHTRCKKCPRYPAPKKDAKGKGAAAGAVGTSTAAKGDGDGKRLATQRAGVACHKCQTTFGANSFQCEKCKHVRCPQCPPDP